MKTFTTIKIGYTAGIYGCSGEYFNTIIIDGDNIDNFYYSGMYGAEERVAQELKALGFKEVYTPSFYGQLKRNDIPKGRFNSEYITIVDIQEKYGQY